jgi:hypothetical protein
VHLDGAWHRQDPRGNKPGVDAQFTLSGERLAWLVRPTLGECDYPEVFVCAHPTVVTALAEATNMLDLSSKGLPECLPGKRRSQLFRSEVDNSSLKS